MTVKNKKTTYISDGAGQTKKLGLLLAKTILDAGAGKKAFVLALRGDLGAGKTQFVQGFAKGLGIEETINSPTFVILKRYPFAGGGFKTFYHIDCYRLESGKDLEQLESAKIFADPANIVAIEWPDVAGNVLPKGCLGLDFEVIGEKQRRIAIGFKL